MSIDELIVTLKMMDIDYNNISDGDGNYLGIGNYLEFFASHEELIIIASLLRQSKLKWNYIAIAGKLKGIYINY